MTEPTAEISEPEAQEVPEVTPAAESTQEPPSETAEAPKRGKGRPAGSKDKAKRVVKPKVRVEPIPTVTPATSSTEAREPEPPEPPAPEPEPPAQEPEPPSPRTLYRETSRHLVHLRGLINHGRTSEVASRYTQKLTQWPVV